MLVVLIKKTLVIEMKKRKENILVVCIKKRENVSGNKH
jgi:hypothetical protein